MAPYTDRGKAYFEALFHFFSWSILAPRSVVLEIGCGEGNLIRDFAVRNHNCTCTNNPAYGVHNWRISQVATNFGVPTAVGANKTVRVLNVDYTHGLPFPNRTFDFVVSMHAFNEGKLRNPNQLGFVLTEVERVMKDNAHAAIHLFEESPFNAHSGLLQMMHTKAGRVALVWGSHGPKPGQVTMQIVPRVHHEWSRARQYAQKYWSSLTAYGV